MVEAVSIVNVAVVVVADAEFDGTNADVITNDAITTAREKKLTHELSTRHLERVSSVDQEFVNAWWASSAVDFVCQIGRAHV